MTTEEPIVVPVSPLEQQLKGQVRLAIAAIAGALILRNIVPAWLVNDQTVDLVAGSVMLGLASIWSWTRAKLSHTRLFTVASDPRVPDSVAQVQS